MRKVAVSFAAVMMVLASFATPSFAAGPTVREHNGQNFRATLSVPETAAPGGTLSARLSIRVNNDGTSAPRRMVSWQIAAPDLRQQRSGFNAFPVDKTKNITKSFAIPTRIQPGVYQIGVQIDVDGESWNQIIDVEIVAK